MDENNAPSVHNPHDRFFKETFSRPETAREFFQACLPARLVEAIDWPSLELAPPSFIDERLTECSSDLLYSVRARGKPLLLYCLFEHQSRVDPNMPFRLLVYMARAWEYWRKQTPGEEKPPCIVPVVLHQGAEPWTVSTRFLDWLGMPEGLETELGPYQPDFDHVLFDLSQVPLERMRLEAALHLVLSLMKAAREGKLAEWLNGVGAQFAGLLTSADGAEFFRRLMIYTLAVESGTSTVEQFIAKIENKTIREGAMSIAEQLIQRGRQEGRQEGRREGRQEGLEEGRQKGWLNGQIQLCQRLLRVPVMSEETLEKLPPAERARLLEELQARLFKPGI